jgi:hypothetical protein
MIELGDRILRLIVYGIDEGGSEMMGGGKEGEGRGVINCGVGGNKVVR